MMHITFRKFIFRSSFRKSFRSLCGIGQKMSNSPVRRSFHKSFGKKIPPITHDKNLKTTMTIFFNHRFEISPERFSTHSEKTCQTIPTKHSKDNTITSSKPTTCLTPIHRIVLDKILLNHLKTTTTQSDGRKEYSEYAEKKNHRREYVHMRCNRLPASFFAALTHMTADYNTRMGGCVQISNLQASNL